MSQKQSPPKKMTQVQFDEQVRRNSAAIQDGCIAATPKPRAGEHVMESGGAHPAIVRELQESVIALRAERDTLRAQRNKAWDERDSLRERERELVEALAELAGDIEGIYDYCKRKDLMVVSIGQFRRRNAARALLSKHGR